jgi:hypothetical protein
MSQLAYNHDWKLYWTLYKHLGCNRIATESGGGFGAGQAHDGVHFWGGALLSFNRSDSLKLALLLLVLGVMLGASDTCTGILLWELASLRLYVFDTVCSSSPCFTAHQLQLNWLFPFFIQMSFRLSACKVVSLQLRRSYHSITKPTNRSIRNGIPKTFYYHEHEQLTCA